MFTGLVSDVGTVEHATRTPEGLELRVRTDYSDLERGESIAINGVCLTVREAGEHSFTVAAVTPTVERTAIGEWGVGTRVNLERALRASDRMGGHMVQGHVDGVATVVAAVEQGDALMVDIRLPAELAETVIPQGSFTVDGVSLTVQAMPEKDIARFAVIDHTRRHTTLGTLRGGTRVHVETDVVGKYVRHFVRGAG